MAEVFYWFQLVICLSWWALLKRVTGKHLYDLQLSAAVLTRPSWCPPQLLLVLHQHRAPVFIALPLALALAAVWDSGVTRVVVALTMSVYHLTESSATNRHGEYPTLYITWALCLPGPLLASSVALGVVVHFLLSSGVAKLLVGGRAWADPSTMQTYLDAYRDSQSARPLQPALSRWVAERAWATRGLSVATLLLECALLPACFLLPPRCRWLGTIAMVLMHTGIALMMSAKVGIAFLTTLPAYVVGFGCLAPLGSWQWCIGLSIGVLPSALAARGGALPENWPSSPVSLFMWNGAQAQWLTARLMKGDTRVVMATASVKGLEGLRVESHGMVQADQEGKESKESKESSDVLYDAVLRVVGFTLVQARLQEAWDAVSGQWDEDKFISLLTAWLCREQRMLEQHTGRVLVRAALVRIEKNRVVEVLLDGAREA